jgi:hypothetical protein
MTSGQDVSDFLDTWVWLNHILSFLGEKNREKKDFFLCAPDAPEEQEIFLFEGLFSNPDMPLSLRRDPC